jgi:predicted DNA-binding transcriptional regulator AlpA
MSITLPADEQVLSEEEAAKICGFSKWTLRRQVAAGIGPRVIRLSARRIGYRIRDLRSWLETRTEGAVQS